ncbi:MAG TPA: GGDEF domain-containing protein [Pseudohongiella sp.]|nr:GGDEF domain-containing protein [Pseudohongiella sp.]
MIDVTTLFVAIIIVNFSLALIIALVSIHVDKSPIAMSAAQACSGLSFLMFGLTGVIDPVFTVIVGNMLIIAVFALAGEGLYLFRQERAPHLLLWTPVVLVGLVFTQLMDNINARTLVGAATIFFQCIHLIVVSSGIRLTEASRGRKLFVLCFATVGCIHMVRIISVLWGGSQVTSVTESGFMQLMTFLPVMTQSLLMAIGIIVMEKERAQAVAQELALHDPLTGLANRRLLYDSLYRAFEQCANERKFGAAILIDLDNFKPVNDRYGHAVGDLLLQSVASRIRSCVRQGDTIARLGGDEFVVVLPALDTDAEKAQGIAESIAEEIRQRVGERYLLPAPTEDYSDIKEPLQVECSGSVGIHLFAGSQCTPDKVLNQADQAMYQAKNLRGNKLSTFSV